MVAMQRVIEPSNHPRGIAEGRMLGHVFDPPAVNPDFSAIVEALEKLLAGIGQRRGHAYGLLCETESACAARLLRSARNDGVDGPLTASMCQSWVSDANGREPSMKEVT